MKQDALAKALNEASSQLHELTRQQALLLERTSGFIPPLLSPALMVPSSSPPPYAAGDESPCPLFANPPFPDPSILRNPLSTSIYGCTCTTPNMSGFPDILG
jgi:hypothetical protein